MHSLSSIHAYVTMPYVYIPPCIYHQAFMHISPCHMCIYHHALMNIPPCHRAYTTMQSCISHHAIVHMPPWFISSMLSSIHHYEIHSCLHDRIFDFHKPTMHHAMCIHSYTWFIFNSYLSQGSHQFFFLGTNICIPQFIARIQPGISRNLWACIQNTTGHLAPHISSILQSN